MADREKVVKTLTELFIKSGYSGTSLRMICQATRLGKGSIYHMFPKGKAQMLRTVLDHIAADFSSHVLDPLDKNDINAMFDGLEAFYKNGEISSLTGMTALDANGENFRDEVRAHYDIWRGALTKALINCGVSRGEAASLSERTIAGIEGALVLTNAFDDAGALGRTCRTLKTQIFEAVEKNSR